MNVAAPYEIFAALETIEGLSHGFIQRVPNLPLQVQREEALTLLSDYYQGALSELGLAEKKFIAAQQVHGNRVVRVNTTTASPVADCDGLVTDDPDVFLGIYTADCGAIYLVDPIHRAIGLLHSGKKGTELGILTVAIAAMKTEFGSDPAELIIQLGPCIRPPHYEIDFAAHIGEQAAAAGVQHYVDCRKDTAADLAAYYSYRQEKGKTGRLLAVLGYRE